MSVDLMYLADNEGSMKVSLVSKEPVVCHILYLLIFIKTYYWLNSSINKNNTYILLFN